MKRTMKKLVALTVATAVCFPTSLVVSAATPQNDLSISYIESSQSQLDVVGMDQYMTLTEQGTIALDTTSAKNNGFSQEAIAKVQSQINSMNNLVLERKAYINNSFEAVTNLSRGRAAVRGQSKIVRHWYGLTEVYMNSIETQALIDNFGRVSATSTMAGLLSLIPGKLFSNLGVIDTLYSVSVQGYSWQIQQAAKSGRGIIMNIQINTETNMPMVWFVSQ